MKIPDYVSHILEQLNKGGFEAYVVGGCVRDFLMEKIPKDWDITTNAKPEEILAIFDFGKYENNFGTVLLPIRDGEVLLDVIEVTTYRSEQGYSDRRHPDEVIFETEIDKDLERRDFTVNAMALAPFNEKLLEKEGRRQIEVGGAPFVLIDLFGGEKDIRKKVLRAVGEPMERFKEDALRMLRAVRFISQLGFELEPKTQRAIVKLAGSVKFVSKERIRDELIKILDSDKPSEGIRLLHDCKLLQYILPELEEGVGMAQNHHHIYQVYEHNVLTLKNCPSDKWTVRLAALLHDVAKPKTRKVIDGVATFYNHEYVGAKMTSRIMDRLKFSNEDKDIVVNLVKNHMFYYQVGEVTAASVRRLIVKVGRENLQDLIHLRMADRVGSGTPKALPYKLQHLQYMMEKVQHDPVSVKMLKINGNDLMTDLKMEPSPKMGAILDVLLSEVLEDPELNIREHLLERAKDLQNFDLAELRAKAQEVIEEKQIEEDKKIKNKYLKNKNN
jgi:poly(A) polymerase/tRNA nucleotidyltransferase (CCA-adding enzyme)